MKEPGEIRILIAEDDFLAGEMIKSLVAEAGYKFVGKAVNGRQAIELTKLHQPDLILMDIKMPDMDGLAAAKEIQRQQPTPIVMLTAYDTEDLAEEASQAGAGAYLVKPADLRTLRRAVTIALARFADLTALRHSHARLEQALADLQAAQTKLLEQERLAAVGQLAAGLAHEYNNIMAAILLYTEMLLQKNTLSAHDQEWLNVIYEQGQRAANLTEKILDFAREAVLQQRELTLNHLLADFLAHLQRTIPPNIQVRLALPDEEVIIRADPERVHQALINLALNAREAMPEGGEMGINLGQLHLSENDAPPLPEMMPGDWACITVSDSGTGIPADVLPHIFEPFFTTRAPLNSGLGLAQVYGIVKQHGGHVAVKSEVGLGTTISLYFPILIIPTPSEPQ